MTYSVNRRDAVLSAEKLGDNRWCGATAVQTKVDVRSFGTPKMHNEETVQVPKISPLPVNFSCDNFSPLERTAAANKIA